MYATKSRRHFAATGLLASSPVPLIEVLRPQSSTKDSSIIIIMLVNHYILICVLRILFILSRDSISSYVCLKVHTQRDRKATFFY